MRRTACFTCILLFFVLGLTGCEGGGESWLGHPEAEQHQRLDIRVVNDTRGVMTTVMLVVQDQWRNADFWDIYDVVVPSGGAMEVGGLRGNPGWVVSVRVRLSDGRWLSPRYYQLQGHENPLELWMH